PVRLPLDCNSACFGGNREYPLPLTTSVISRALIERLGGFAGGLRYAADTEFVRRAIFIARVVNTRERYYYRRVHTGAATVNPDTGRESPLRKTIHQAIDARWRENCARLSDGLAPDLSPFAI